MLFDPVRYFARIAQLWNFFWAAAGVIHVRKVKGSLLAVAHIYISSVQVSFVLEKVEEGPYWDRLLDSKLKQHWLKIDYKNWVDEDEEEEPGQGQDLGE